jgi:hypothetical protein
MINRQCSQTLTRVNDPDIRPTAPDRKLRRHDSKKSVRPLPASLAVNPLTRAEFMMQLCGLLQEERRRCNNQLSIMPHVFFCRPGNDIHQRVRHSR